jgi:phage-related protein (TIGR01555 family)
MSGAELVKAGAAAVIDAVARADDWSNEMLGIGGSKDPSVYTTFSTRGLGLSDPTLEALYVEDHFAAKVVECIVRHGMRRGWDLVLPGDPKASAEQRAAYEVLEEVLCVAEQMALGACWGRLFGGAVTWIGVDDGRAPHMPVDEAAIESIGWLHTFDRRVVVVETRYAHPDHPRFQQPETFRIYPQTVTAVAALGGAHFAGGAVVHESRVIVWPGERTTDQRKLERAGWDDSVLERCWQALRQTGEDYSGKSQLLARISQFVFKIKGLGAIITAKEPDFRRRMNLLDASRSRSRALVIDTEEDVVNVTQPIAGVDTLIDKSVERLAIAAGIPLTVFVGRPPTGASGESELETWYGEVESWQREVLLPRHTRIARLCLLAKKGPVSGKEPETWRVQYRPLRTPKPKEAAELSKLVAETDAVMIDKGVYTPESVALGRFTSTSSGAVVLDTAEVSAALQRRKDLAAQPPKDNAELGTVAPRSAAIGDVIAKTAAGTYPRANAKALLEVVHRLTPEDAERLLPPEPAVPVTGPPKGTPGPAPAPQLGQGAGAPQGSPGFNAGGDPSATEG